jgi:hypothetical protein
VSTAPAKPRKQAKAPEKPPARSDLPPDFAFAPPKPAAPAAGENGHVDENEPLLDLSTIAPKRPTIRIRCKGDACECGHPYSKHHADGSDEPVDCCAQCSRREPKDGGPGYRPSGGLYDLHLLTDFGIAEQQQLMRDGETYDELWGKTGLTSGERKTLEQTLDRMFNLVLDAPVKVKASISDAQKSQIVQAFTVAPFALAARAAQLTEEAQETEETGEDDPSTTDA